MKRKRLRESRLVGPRSLIGLLLLVAAQTSGQSHPEEVVVIFPRGREAIPVSVFAGVSMLPLDKIADLVGASIHTEPRSSAATFSVGGRTARISPGRALLRVEGELVLLSAPSTVRAGRWFVPLDFLGKVLPRVAGESITYRDDLRLLVIGEGFPRLSVRALPYPAYTRVVVESTIEIPFQVTQAGRQVQVLVLANYLETDFQAEELRDGVVEKIALFRRTEDYLLTIDLGERFGTVKVFELRNPARVVLDMFRSRVPTEVASDSVIAALEPHEEDVPDAKKEPGGGDVPRAAEEEDRMKAPLSLPDLGTDTGMSPSGLSRRARGGLRNITVDPGHGGAESGATGPAGLQEKDVTLAIAQRLRQILENRLGVRIQLTRDGDLNLALDERTAMANHNKSDLFISIHANGSSRRNARGSEVYYLSYEASDEESRRVAAAENAFAQRGGAGMDSDLEFILWDMAQSAYLNESAFFAELLQDELRADTRRKADRGIKQAPFRVLMGATMPAVLVEVGFITNPEEEKLLGSASYQDQVARAIYQAVLRYKERYERKLLGLDSLASKQEAR